MLLDTRASGVGMDAEVLINALLLADSHPNHGNAKSGTPDDVHTSWRLAREVKNRASMLAAAFFWLCLSLLGAGVEISATASAQEAASLTNSGVSRLEGYLYLDTKGRPLPIQTDAEIESFLTEAEIIDERQIPTGITHPLELTLKTDGIEAHAAFNDVNIRRRNVTEEINGRCHFSFDWRDSYRYSIAAYRLDRLLGLYRVPPVVCRRTRKRQGAISIWLAGTVTENQRELELKADPPNMKRWNGQRLLLLLFDNLVANRDSNFGNLLIDANWRLWFIDCTRCFGDTKVLYYPLEDVRHCERGMWEGLRSSSEDEIREALALYLSKAEMKALLARRAKILRHFEKLIAENGEAAVLYDIDPPSGTAPWAEAERR